VRHRSLGAVVGLLLLLLATGVLSADLGEAGRAAYARGDYEAAERLFKDAVGRAPNDALLRYHRAAALTKLGRWDEAIDEYERVLQLRPTEDLAAASRGALKTLVPLTRRTSPRQSDVDESTVRLERAGGGWLVNVVLNDTRKARFLVDTGASLTVLSPELADELGIKPSRPPRILKLLTMSGETEGPAVTIPSLQVGDHEARGVAGVIHALPDLEGILGNTFLARFSITLDARRGLLIVRRR
jgi:clan AA aspartic protease (TIGR02281 family)